MGKKYDGDEFARLAEMLKSIDPDLDYPDNTRLKAQVMRARFGSINVPTEKEHLMVAICECGWRGVMADCQREQYDSGAESWRRHTGRSGWHWNCPRCGAVVWRYYNEIN